MPGIIIQNLPFIGSPSRCVRTQYGGTFVHILGGGTTIRQAAYDALALVPAGLFAKFEKALIKMILDLKDNGTIGNYQIRISIPHNFAPRQYVNGKQHPGKPDVIDHHYTIATFDRDGLFSVPVFPDLPVAA